MANTIDVSFVKQFESDVHLAFQRMGSKLLNTVRRKTNVIGSSVRFPIIGKAAAGQKARNGQVPINNLVHSYVETTLADYYSAEWLDKLDELKINHDERLAQARSLSAALGRKADDIIVQAVDATTNETTDTGALTLAKMEEIFEYFGDNDVPDDGRRMLAVSPQGWTDLMNLPEFSSTDYVPPSELPYPVIGYTAKRWFSFLVCQFSGLNTAGAVRHSLAYHYDAVGAASGQEVSMDLTWQGKEQAWLAVASMSQSAVIIDNVGTYRLRHTEV